MYLVYIVGNYILHTYTHIHTYVNEKIKFSLYRIIRKAGYIAYYIAERYQNMTWWYMNTYLFNVHFISEERGLTT